MKKTRLVGSVVVSVFMALLLGGCGTSSQARKVDVEEANLVNPALLKKGDDDQALYRYLGPNANMKQYTKVLVDPIMVKKDGQLDKEELENYQTLANNAYVYLTKELEKDYSIVKTPEPGAVRIQMAIIDADSSKPVRNTLATVFPIGMAVSLVKYSATGKSTGVGEITAEMRITDATTGELLAAALDRRVGEKKFTKLWSSWYNADEALKYWAERTRFAFCQLRSGMNCVKPGSE